MAILNTVAQFGRYMLRSRLATAGICEVWLAQVDGAAHGTAPIVFKKLRTDYAADASLAAAFTQRAERAILLGHDCIGDIFDVVADHSARGYAMEYIDGRTLRQLISAVGSAGNALPVWFALHVTRRICQALEHAHNGIVTEGQAHQVTHDHLVPENVFLTFLGNIKVTDFGLSEAALVGRRGASMRAPTKSVRHELPFTAVASVQYDLECVGRILFELLTGNCPESGGVTATPFVPPSHYAPWVNVEVDHLIARILSPADEHRFGSAREIGQALDDYLSSRRHEVSSSHVAGLVSVLFAAECMDSSPPTIRLQEGAAELAMLRSRRTTPPVFAPCESQTSAGAIQGAVTVPPCSQTSRETVRAPQAPEAAEDNALVGEARPSPFRHDWDLALKRAREEAQTALRGSGNFPIATVAAPTEVPVDPLDQAIIEFERGLELMRSGNFEGALGAWARALEFDPQHRVCRANLNLLKKKLAIQT